MASVAARLEAVVARISSGSRSQSVVLCAVGKLQPLSLLNEAYLAGQRDFGENYVNELVEKATAASRSLEVLFTSLQQRAFRGEL